MLVDEHIVTTGTKDKCHLLQLPRGQIMRQHVSVFLRDRTVTHMSEFCSLNRTVPTSNAPLKSLNRLNHRVGASAGVPHQDTRPQAAGPSTSPGNPSVCAGPALGQRVSQASLSLLLPPPKRGAAEDSQSCAVV